MKIDVSLGELIDKHSILAIKLNKIHDPEKLKNVRTEFTILDDLFFKLHRSLLGRDIMAEFEELCRQLLQVNKEIWEIEDNIRLCEQKQDFGPKFIQYARGVYHKNDHRAKIKKSLNILLESGIVEEKSYADYSQNNSNGQHL